MFETCKPQSYYTLSDFINTLSIFGILYLQQAHQSLFLLADHVFFHAIQVKKSQYGHFRRFGSYPKKKVKSFPVTENGLLHPGIKIVKMFLMFIFKSLCNF